jgi:ribose-phosphate pyrophosphokinase
MIKLNGVQVIPTIFPDGTSQVWNVKGISPISNHILWDFENEGELFQVAQLVGLLNVTYPYSTTLEMPFMPYARQDKLVSNHTTFAGQVFVAMIDSWNVRVVVTDVHNAKLLPNRWVNLGVKEPLRFAVEATMADLICFPDQGASKRDYPTFGRDDIILHKKRNQQTGEIEGLQMLDEISAGAKVLIVDDLCDGGKTFIEAAKVLYKAGASEVNLFTSHGLYTKGLGVLREAGIKRIFNKNGEV